MPPFWMAFSLTLTETVGGGMLAIPIALAWVGVPLGLVLLVSLRADQHHDHRRARRGASPATGSMRYGNGYFGRLVENRLGRPGGGRSASACSLLEAVGLLAALHRLRDRAVGADRRVVARLARRCSSCSILFVLRRESLDATIAAALLIGIAILFLAAGLIVLGLVNVQPELLTAPRSAAAGGFPLRRSSSACCCTSTSATPRPAMPRARCCAAILSGRTLLWGNVAAMAAAAVIYVLFVVAVNGSVPAALLAAETGTAIGPLEEVAGPSSACWARSTCPARFGIGAVFGSLGLYLQAEERFGSRVPAGRLGRSSSSRRRRSSRSSRSLAVMLRSDLGSFTGPLSLVGALVVPLLGGVFPMLILAPARRRGERVPGTPLRWLGSPGGRDARDRALPGRSRRPGAVHLGRARSSASSRWSRRVAMVALIIVSVRRGSFVPRTVVELRADEPPGAGAGVAVVADGQQRVGSAHCPTWPPREPSRSTCRRIGPPSSSSGRTGPPATATRSH